MVFQNTGIAQTQRDGDTLTDLSTDFGSQSASGFDRYNRDGKTEANLRFFLFTTGSISNSSFPVTFLVERQQKTIIQYQ